MTTQTRAIFLYVILLVFALAQNAGAIGFVQVNSATPQTPQSSVTVTYPSAQSAGDLNVVVVGWNDSTAMVNSVTDTKGNVYQLAVGPTVRAGAATQSIYFAKSIAASAARGNAVTVRFNVPAEYPDIRILEYSGLDVTDPVDVTAAATGSNSTSNSGSATTKNANDLIFGANLVLTSTRAAGAGFTRRIITSPDGDIAEDRTVTAVGNYNASAPLTSAGQWIMQMVAFKAGLPDLTIAKTHIGTFNQGQAGATYTIMVTNVGTAPTNGTVTVTDTLPAGLTATALGGTGWSCNLSSLTCTRSNALAATASYPAITLTVNVAANAPVSMTNTATVSGGGDNSPANNTANDVTAVNTLAPSVTINQASGQADPTNASTINFTVTFSKPVIGFGSGGVVIGGTAGGMKSVVVTGSFTTYNVAVSGMTPGTVTASVTANAAQDAAGNGNTASTSTDNSVTYNIPAPSVTINQAAGQADPTKTSPINFTVIFSNPVIGFGSGGVIIGGTAGGTKSVVVTGDFATYNVAVSGMTPGTVTASVAANAAQDAAGNGNTASTSTDNSVMYDTTAPTVTINQASGQADPTNLSPVNFTVIFSKPVTGFGSTGVTIGGTSGGTKSVAVTGSGTTYNVAIGGMTAGTITAAVAANAAQDAAGNGNTASTSTDNSVTYSVPTTPTLVAAYGFNEGTGTTVVDASGNGNTGTTGGTAWTTAGKYGNALSFNGTSSYVDLGNPALLSITGSMTLSAWVLATGDPADDGQIIAKSNDSSGWQLKSSLDTGSQTFGIAISPNGTSHVQRYSKTVRSLNTWYHVAGVYNAVAQTLDIYVNGVLDNGVLSGTVPSAQFDAAQNVNIGRRSGGFYFQGTIDEVRIYNTVLTQAQIQADMTPPISQPVSPVPDLTITKTHPGNFTPGQIGASYTTTVTNLGPGPTNGTVTVTDTLPAALTATALSGTGWNCTLATLTCTRSDSLAATASYPAITLTVNVAANAPNSVTNAATVSGGGDNSPGNNTANDPTTIGTGVSGPVYPLKASANGRYLVDQNNVPFLITGDSPQALTVNLSETKADTFLSNRMAAGFNTVWVNLLCTTYTGGRADGSTYDGIAPFTTAGDLATPNEAFFTRVDNMIRLAAKYGITVFLDPIETGGWLNTLRTNGVTRARAYGQYLGNRYKNFDNIVWMNGNDFQTWTTASDDALVRAVAIGIQDMDTRHIHTVQLNFNVSGSLDDRTWAPLIQLDAAYTYYPTYAQVLNEYNRPGFIPVFMVEANYEFENNTGSDYGSPALLRRQEYWSALSGAAGQLYGNHYTWQFLSGWQSYLDTPGSVQMGYMKALFEPRRWYDLVPDQDHTVVTAGYGTFSSTGTISSNDYATTARTADGTLAMAYLPTRRTITVNMARLAVPATAQWYDPSNGTYTTISGSPFANTGTRQFTPPGNNSVGDGDWVLVLTADLPL